MSTPSKIFIYAIPDMGIHKDDLVGYAVAEDGTPLKSHLSSSMEFLRRDMGIAAPFFVPEQYANHYPGGYTLVDLTALDTVQLEAHEELTLALERNKQRADTAE